MRAWSSFLGGAPSFNTAENIPDQFGYAKKPRNLHLHFVVVSESRNWPSKPLLSFPPLSSTLDSFPKQYELIGTLNNIL